jgi:3-oxo-5-alpha-steroid 4-dehydrogenase 1
MGEKTFNFLVGIWIAVAVITFIILLFIKAPYGRHSSHKWGITISNRWAWFGMEIPSLMVFLLFFIMGKSEKNLVTWIIAVLYLFHYINRSLIYPFRIRTKGKEMPLIIALMAVFFNFVNGSFLGYYLGTLQQQYTIEWFTDYRFVAGLFLFFTGMFINLSSDEKLIHLRKISSNGYQIPNGGLFNWISCPNFFGEIIEWLGYALMCWSLPALSFFIWTCCNLIPRALNHHRWYRKEFENYPPERKAIFPYIL